MYLKNVLINTGPISPGRGPVGPGRVPPIIICNYSH